MSPAERLEQLLMKWHLAFLLEHFQDGTADLIALSQCVQRDSANSAGMVDVDSPSLIVEIATHDHELSNPSPRNLAAISEVEPLVVDTARPVQAMYPECEIKRYGARHFARWPKASTSHGF
jgi:hypothetical protein